MRRLFLLLFVSTPFFLFAQDDTWTKDITKQVGLDTIICFRPHVVDLNNDGYHDLLILNDSVITVLLNQPNDEGGRKFIDYTEESGINYNPRNPDLGKRRVANLSMADVDNDGDPDLVSCLYFHRVENYTDNGDNCDLLLNDGNAHFTWVEGGDIKDLRLLNSTGICFLDYNLDGQLDFYIATWSQDHTRNIFDHDFLLKGDGNAAFTDVTEQAGVDKVSFPMYGVNMADWNNDGWPDVFTSPYCRSGGSVWKNNQDGTFSDIAAEVGYNAHTMKGDNGQELCQWGAEPMDFDQDGDIDFYIILVHGGIDPNEGHSTILINKGPEEGYKLEWALDRVERDKFVAPHHGDRYVSWFDLDNDGWMDMVGSQNGTYDPVGKRERIYFWRQNDKHFFDDITFEIGLARDVKQTGGLMAFDYDNDGDDDILVAGEQNKLMLIENRIGNKKNHVSVKLIAPPGVNKSCVGARVTVYAKDYMQIREVYAGQGNFTTLAPFVLNYGLGDRTEIDSIVVRWPRVDLPTTTVYNVPVNEQIVIDHGARNEKKDQLVSLYSAKPVILPNPAQNQVTVNMPVVENSKVGIYDLLGNIMFEYVATDKNAWQTIDVSNWNNGVYLVRTNDSQGLSSKLVIRR